MGEKPHGETNDRQIQTSESDRMGWNGVVGGLPDTHRTHPFVHPIRLCVVPSRLVSSCVRTTILVAAVSSTRVSGHFHDVTRQNDQSARRVDKNALLSPFFSVSHWGYHLRNPTQIDC
ncbi:unnamed protein product [Toxocara canis]|uniref:Uncharacterized protein n=1 Tax=Toxocara canis TaxID=6265 RepID=A0A3P7GVG3_TOXCA|nr:unnamed protein product [Toxocara canis]